MSYLFDNNISPRLAAILRHLDVSVQHLKERFPADVRDEDYLPQIRDLGWVLVTCDLKMRRKPIQAEALRSSRVTAIFLGSFFLKMNLWKQAEWLLKHWPRLEEFSSTVKQGTVGLAHQGGRVEILSSALPTESKD